ncbi:MAG: rhomboid family intramembrane serine protease [Candidatus Bipolaricaulia bacterium]
MIPLRDYRHGSSFPVVTVAIIVINILVFLYQFSLSNAPATEDTRQWVRAWQRAGCDIPAGLYYQLARPISRFSPSQITAEDEFTFRFGVIPCEITKGADLPPFIPFTVWLTLLTAMFMHAGFWHILGNMWYLWIFGDNVEDVFGRLGYVLFYLLSGLAAAFAQILTNPNTVIPMVGASGAISGVLGAYFVLFPYGRVLTLVPLFPFFVRLIELPAILLLGFWFVLQFLGGISSPVEGGGVAYWAHAGGFVTGALLALLVKRRVRPYYFL